MLASGCAVWCKYVNSFVIYVQCQNMYSLMFIVFYLHINKKKIFLFTTLELFANIYIHSYERME